MPGVETRFAPDAKPQKEDKKPTKRLEKTAKGVQSVFVQKLTAEAADGDCWCLKLFSFIMSTLKMRLRTDETFFDYTKMLSPATLDLELRSLVTLDNVSLFINALTRRLQSHRDFEAVQAMQNVFLKMHGELFIANHELRSQLEKLAETQKKESQRVLDLLASSLGTLDFVRSVV